MADPIVTVINTLAKVPHDAFHIVARHGDSKANAEVVDMQLPVGLGGGTCDVPFKRGMSLAELKQQVFRMTRIPVSEQVYVASDGRLIDANGEVPTDPPPLCLWARLPRESESIEQVAPSSTVSLKASRSPESRTKWADLSDSCEELDLEEASPTCAAVKTEQKPPNSITKPGPLATCQWQPKISRTFPTATARCERVWEFTTRWRAFAPKERQHQFYIALSDEAYLEEHQVPRKIRQACGNIYREGQVMVRLRGHGSGFLEVKWMGRQWESTDPLMICLSGRVPYDMEAYWEAFYKIALLLEEDVYGEYNRLLAKTCRTGRVQELHLDDDWVHAGRRQGGRRPKQTLYSHR